MFSPSPYLTGFFLCLHVSLGADIVLFALGCRLASVNCVVYLFGLVNSDHGVFDVVVDSVIYFC